MTDIHTIVRSRLPRAMSVSGLKMLNAQPMDWVAKYILKQNTFVQTLPMAIGVVFDAMAKGELCSRLYGEDAMVTVKGGSVRACDVRDWMIDSGLQAGPYKREDAIGYGGKVYDHYVKLGALGSLCSGLSALGVTAVRLETKLVGTIGPDVPFIGYPDLECVGADGMPIILDWKTTGVMGSLNSGKGVSPKPLYGDQWSANSKWHRVPHKKCEFPKRVGGLAIGGTLGEWEDQVIAYDEVLRAGAEGSTLGLIHLSCGIGGDRIAQYGKMIEAADRRRVAEAFTTAWACLKTGHVPGLDLCDLERALGSLMTERLIEGLGSGKYGDDDFKECL